MVDRFLADEKLLFIPGFIFRFEKLQSSEPQGLLTLICQYKYATNYKHAFSNKYLKSLRFKDVHERVISYNVANEWYLKIKRFISSIDEA